MAETMTTSKEMPRYKCYKEVHALKIARIGATTNAGTMITPADEGFDPFTVDAAYMKKHNPEAGGYYVVYADGYESFSPTKAFEEGYTKL